MTTSEDQVALEMVLRTLPTERGVVLMVTPDGQIESAALGLSDGEVLLTCWSVAVQMAAQTPEGIAIFQRMLDEALQKQQPPTTKPRLYVAKGVVPK